MGIKRLGKRWGRHEGGNRDGGEKPAHDDVLLQTVLSRSALLQICATSRLAAEMRVKWFTTVKNIL